MTQDDYSPRSRLHDNYGDDYADPMNSSVFNPPQEVHHTVRIVTYHLKTASLVCPYRFEDRLSAYPNRIYPNSSGVMAWTETSLSQPKYSPAALLEHQQSGI